MKLKPWIKILIGLALGIAFGLIFQKEYKILTLLGKAFIDLLKMVVGLIVFSSITTGICHIHDPKKLGRIGLRTLIFFAVTTLIAITFAMLLAAWLKPGAGLNLPIPVSDQTGRVTLGVLDFLANIIPSNPFAAFVNSDILQVIVFAVFFAYALILAKDKGKPVLEFLESVSEVMHTLTHVIMKYAPIGVFALIATSVGSIGFKVLLPLGSFLICNYVATILQIVIVFSLCIKFLAKLEIAPFYKGMKDAIVLAFTTSSSSATLPISLECTREHLGISEDISGFVMSLGSTINMNGAAIGQAVASFFIAQAYGIELGPLKIIVLYVTALLSAIGAAGIPGTGIVMLSMVLNAIGLPLEGIALVAGVDRLREMVSSVANVLGDGVAAVYVARVEKQINVEQYHAVTWLE
ncbi:MAG: dicarboxylate/amino acid:cation symporter [Rhabdochlamydiaceae bacterium]|nr:dicarboxylate/amino acid:cation symporter [Candidatus Amphrikana amoebophyrae]